MNKIRIGVLGGGVNSAVGGAHRIALKLSSQFEIVEGCFSRNSEINKRSRDLWEIQSGGLTNSFEDLIEKKELFDLVLILTPTHSHYDQILKLVENGVDIIVEKSAVSSSAEALRIRNVLKSNKRFMRVIYNYTGYPAIWKIKEMVDNYELGRLMKVVLRMPQEGFIRVAKNGSPIVPQSWRMLDYEIPTVSLDLGTHLYSILKFTTSLTPISNYSILGNYGNFHSLIDNVETLSKAKDGELINFSYGKINLGDRNGLSLEIYGSKSSIKWVQENPEVILKSDNLGNKQVIDRGSPNAEIMNLPSFSNFKPGHPAGFIEALSNYYAKISSDYQNFMNGKEANESFGIDHVVEALRFFSLSSESNRQGREIKLNN